MSLFSQATAAVVAAVATAITVNVCTAASFTGTSTHYSKPSPTRINVDDIAHRGPYFGARHTGSLDKARSTIFLKPGTKSAPGIMALHVEQSPMVLTHLIMASKTAAKNDHDTPAVAPTAAPQPKLEAPAPRPTKSLLNSGV